MESASGNIGPAVPIGLLTWPVSRDSLWGERGKRQSHHEDEGQHVGTADCRIYISLQVGVKFGEVLLIRDEATERLSSQNTTKNLRWLEKWVN